MCASKIPFPKKQKHKIKQTFNIKTHKVHNNVQTKLKNIFNLSKINKITILLVVHI